MEKDVRINVKVGTSDATREIGKLSRGLDTLSQKAGSVTVGSAGGVAGAPGITGPMSAGDISNAARKAAIDRRQVSYDSALAGSRLSDMKRAMTFEISKQKAATSSRISSVRSAFQAGSFIRKESHVAAQQSLSDDIDAAEHGQKGKLQKELRLLNREFKLTKEKRERSYGLITSKHTAKLSAFEAEEKGKYSKAFAEGGGKSPTDIREEHAEIREKLEKDIAPSRDRIQSLRATRAGTAEGRRRVREGGYMAPATEVWKASRMDETTFAEKYGKKGSLMHEESVARLSSQRAAINQAAVGSDNLSSGAVGKSAQFIKTVVGAVVASAAVSTILRDTSYAASRTIRARNEYEMLPGYYRLAGSMYGAAMGGMIGGAAGGLGGLLSGGMAASRGAGRAAGAAAAGRAGGAAGVAATVLSGGVAGAAQGGLLGASVGSALMGTWGELYGSAAERILTTKAAYHESGARLAFLAGKDYTGTPSATSMGYSGADLADTLASNAMAGGAAFYPGGGVDTRSGRGGGGRPGRAGRAGGRRGAGGRPGTGYSMVDTPFFERMHDAFGGVNYLEAFGWGAKAGVGAGLIGATTGIGIALAAPVGAAVTLAHIGGQASANYAQGGYKKVAPGTEGSLYLDPTTGKPVEGVGFRGKGYHFGKSWNKAKKSFSTGNILGGGWDMFKDVVFNSWDFQTDDEAQKIAGVNNLTRAFTGKDPLYTKTTMGPPTKEQSAGQWSWTGGGIGTSTVTKALTEKQRNDQHYKDYAAAANKLYGRDNVNKHLSTSMSLSFAGYGGGAGKAGGGFAFKKEFDILSQDIERAKKIAIAQELPYDVTDPRRMAGAMLFGKTRAKFAQSLGRVAPGGERDIASSEFVARFMGSAEIGTPQAERNVNAARGVFFSPSNDIFKALKTSSLMAMGKGGSLKELWKASQSDTNAAQSLSIQGAMMRGLFGKDLGETVMAAQYRSKGMTVDDSVAVAEGSRSYYDISPESKERMKALQKGDIEEAKEISGKAAESQARLADLAASAGKVSEYLVSMGNVLGGTDTGLIASFGDMKGWVDDIVNWAPGGEFVTSLADKIVLSVFNKLTAMGPPPPNP